MDRENILFWLEKAFNLVYIVEFASVVVRDLNTVSSLAYRYRLSQNRPPRGWAEGPAQRENLTVWKVTV